MLLVKDFLKESDQAVENGMKVHNNVNVTGEILCHVNFFNLVGFSISFVSLSQEIEKTENHPRLN